MPKFETVIVETDLLIVGGGMAACGAAVEAAYWAKANGLKVTLVDKAAMDRSGAVSQGLSAINQYVGLRDGANTVKDYVDYVRNDLMGVTREDLVADIARHVDSTVHLFEKWGLPIWKDEKGAYVHEGRWQLMINGESYKVVVAEAAKNALLKSGVGRDLRARLHYRSADGWRPLRGRCRLLGAREQGVRLQVQSHAGGHGRRRARLQAAEFGRGLRPRLVSAVQYRLVGVFHAEGRRGNDLPGSAFHPRALQGCLRSGGCVVPAVQVARDQRHGRQLHGRAQGRVDEVGTLRTGEAGSGQPAQLSRHARYAGGQGPAVHADRGGPGGHRRAVQGRSQGLREEDEGAGIGGLGRFPGYDDFAGSAVGRHQRSARAEVF